MPVPTDQWIRVRETVEADGLSVIVPASDVDEVRAAFAAHGVPAQVVGLDGTRYPEHGASLRAAFEASKGGFVLLLAAGMPSVVAQVPEFFATMVTKGADVVVGSKRHERSSVRYPWHRRLLSVVYHSFARRFLGVAVTDTRSIVKLFRRETLGYALDRMLVKQNAFDLEILAIAAAHGARIAEAPVALSPDSGFGLPSGRVIGHIVNDTLAIFYRLRILRYYERCLVPKRLERDPLVSVVIACPNDSWMLRECLDGLRRQTYRNWECLVLPDGETEALEGVRILPTGKIRPAEKRNLGIREAKGEIVAFIDDDATPEEHWLEYAVKYFGDPDIGAVGGPGVTPPSDRWLARIGGRVYDSRLVSGNYRYRYKAGGVRMDVEDYPSCNLFVRKALLDEIGGYRTDFWPGEDTLLCKDIIDSWKRIVYDPWVIVRHHRRPLFLPHLRQLGRYAFHRGYFCKRYPSNSLRPSYFVPTAFVAYLAVLAAAALAMALTGVRAPVGVSVAALAPLAAYLALVVVTSCARNPAVWLLTALGIFLSHVCYGVRFVQGLCAAKAPCEYIGKDHA